MAGRRRPSASRSTLPSISRTRTGTAALAATAPVFAALGDETRLRLVARLGSEGPLSISRLTAGTELTRQAVTKHLQVLAGAGLAGSVSQGRERLWQVRKEPLDEARRQLDLIASRWDETLQRMKTALEDEAR
jgi:DNA-binding transcriptional ArsR family regulator